MKEPANICPCGIARVDCEYHKPDDRNVTVWLIHDSETIAPFLSLADFEVKILAEVKKQLIALNINIEKSPQLEAIAKAYCMLISPYVLAKAYDALLMPHTRPEPGP